MFTVLAGFAPPAISASEQLQIAAAQRKSHSVPHREDVSFSDVWARAARRGGSVDVFLTVKNAGSVPVRLEGAFSDVAA